MSIRTERLSKLIQREVAELINSDFRDELSMVTVTGARVTGDLSIAYVYVSVFGETPAQKQVLFRQLQEMTPQIRGALAANIRHQVRMIPEIRFFLDESLERAQSMEKLFDQIREERAQREAASEDGEERKEGDES